MSTRIAITLATASLLLAVGCATGAEGDDVESTGGEPTTAATSESDMPETVDPIEGDDAADDDSVMPAIQTGVATLGTGYNCACPAGQEMQAGLCYPKCGNGYTGEGPVCWQNCASGFTDTGWFCQRNSHVTSANTKSCPWYNKCGLGSSCSKCPSGYKNDGCTCRRDAYIYAQPSYGRGAGTTPSCNGY